MDWFRLETVLNISLCKQRNSISAGCWLLAEEFVTRYEMLRLQVTGEREYTGSHYQVIYLLSSDLS